MTIEPCPSDDVLKNFAYGTLKSTRVEMHARTCIACAAEVHRRKPQPVEDEPHRRATMMCAAVLVAIIVVTSVRVMWLDWVDRHAPSQLPAATGRHLSHHHLNDNSY